MLREILWMLGSAPYPIKALAGSALAILIFTWWMQSWNAMDPAATYKPGDILCLSRSLDTEVQIVSYAGMGPRYYVKRGSNMSVSYNVREYELVKCPHRSMR